MTRELSHYHLDLLDVSLDLVKGKAHVPEDVRKAAAESQDALKKALMDLGQLAANLNDLGQRLSAAEISDGRNPENVLAMTIPVYLRQLEPFGSLGQAPEPVEQVSTPIKATPPKPHKKNRKEAYMDGLNEVRLIGRLGRDLELKHGQNGEGKPYCHMTLACEKSYMDGSGQRQSRVEWVPVVCFGKTAENCAKFLAKGSLVCVMGEVRTSKRQDKEGKDVYSTQVCAMRVIFLGGKPQEAADGQGAQGSGYAPGEDLGPAFPSEESGMDDVPF